jgi:hypothetical protein
MLMAHEGHDGTGGLGAGASADAFDPGVFVLRNPMTGHMHFSTTWQLGKAFQRELQKMMHACAKAKEGAEEKNRSKSNSNQEVDAAATLKGQPSSSTAASAYPHLGLLAAVDQGNAFRLQFRVLQRVEIAGGGGGSNGEGVDTEWLEGYLVSRLEHHRRAFTKACTKTILRNWRVKTLTPLWVRWNAALDYQRSLERNAAAIDIQRVQRGRGKRRGRKRFRRIQRYVSARHLQRWARGAFGRERARARAGEVALIHHATHLQRVFRGWKGRMRARRFARRRQRKRAAVTIQGAWRIFDSLKIYRAFNRNRQRKIGATKIQGFLRMCAAKQERRDRVWTLLAHRSALVVQNAWRIKTASLQYLARAHMRAEQDQREWAARVVQRGVRCRNARGIVATLKHGKVEGQKAAAIQSRWRGKKGREASATRQAAANRHRMAKRIQRAHRQSAQRCAGKAVLQALRQSRLEALREASATRIQGFYRGRKGKTRFQAIFEAKQQTRAVLKMQGAWRRKEARAYVNVFREEAAIEKCAVKIQQSFRAKQSRKEIQRRRWVVSQGPCHDCRAALAAVYYESTQQELCRPCLKHVQDLEHQFFDDDVSEEGGSPSVSPAKRKRKQSRFGVPVSGMKKREKHMQRIRNKEKGMAKRIIPIDEYRLQNEMSRRLQRCYRRKQKRIMDENGQCQECAKPAKVICTQCKEPTGRLCQQCSDLIHSLPGLDLHRFESILRHREMEKAALKIQCRYRGHGAHMKMWMQKEKEREAEEARLEAEQKALHQAKTQCAVQIQSIFRQKQARRLRRQRAEKARRERERRNELERAALKVQCKWRGHGAHMKMWMRREKDREAALAKERTAAALKIQSFLRRCQAKKVAARQKVAAQKDLEEEASALRIQCRLRTRQAVRKMDEERARKDKAALLLATAKQEKDIEAKQKELQNAATEEEKTRIREELGAMTIQNKYRQRKARRRFLAARHSREVEVACIRIQCKFRQRQAYVEAKKQAQKGGTTTEEGVWQEYWDENAQGYYYYHTGTQEAIWEKPAEFISKAEEALLKEAEYYNEDDWMQYWDDFHQAFYYYHMTTEETQWEDGTTYHPDGSSDLHHADDVLVTSWQDTADDMTDGEYEYQEYWDEESQGYYYHNFNTDDVLWEKPALFYPYDPAYDGWEGEGTGGSYIGANPNPSPKPSPRPPTAPKLHNPFKSG